MKKLLLSSCLVLCAGLFSSCTQGPAPSSSIPAPSSVAEPPAELYHWIREPFLEYDWLGTIGETPTQENMRYLTALSPEGSSVILFDTGEALSSPVGNDYLKLCDFGHLISNRSNEAEQAMLEKTAEKMGTTICGGHGTRDESYSFSLFILDDEGTSLGSYENQYMEDNHVVPVEVNGKPSVWRYYTGTLTPVYGPYAYKDEMLFTPSNPAFGFMNSQGEKLTALYYEDAQEIYRHVNGVIWAKHEDKAGYFSVYDQKIVSDCLYDPLFQKTDGAVPIVEYGLFNEELCPVNLNGRCGYINLSGEMVIPPEFEGATYVLDGKAWVKKDGLWGMIEIPSAGENPEHKDIRFSGN